MRDEYPVPGYAVTAWIAKGKLHVCFPPTVGTKAHTVLFPTTDKGMKLFLKVMQERPSNARLTISAPGEPTSYQIERMLAGDKKYNEFQRSLRITAEQQAELEKILQEEGLL